MSTEKNKNNHFGYLLIGLTLIAIGVLFIIFGESLKVLAIAIGSVLSLFAVIYGILAIAATGRGFVFVCKTALAVISLAAGITTAILNERTVDILISVFSVLLTVDASFKLNTSAMSKRYSLGGWWIPLIPAIITIAGSFYLIKFAPVPTPEEALTQTVLGILIIVDGLANLFQIIFVPMYEKKLRATLYYELNRENIENS